MGSESSAASGGCSEAISRKCPDWRPKQWPGIGWHDGGQENPAPTEGYKGCGRRADVGIGPYGGYKGCNGRATARVAPTKGLQGVRWFLWCVGEGLCPSRGRGRTPPLRNRYMRCGTDKGRPGGPPLRFLYPLFISYIHFLYALFICALRRINLPGAGVYLCRPTRCGPRPGAFPGRWLFPPGRSRCGVRPGSPGPGL